MFWSVFHLYLFLTDTSSAGSPDKDQDIFLNQWEILRASEEGSFGSLVSDQVHLKYLTFSVKYNMITTSSYSQLTTEHRAQEEYL